MSLLLDLEDIRRKPYIPAKSRLRRGGLNEQKNGQSSGLAFFHAGLYRAYLQKKPADKTGSADARNGIYLMFKSLHSIAQGSFLGCVNFYDSACYRVAKREGPLRL